MPSLGSDELLRSGVQVGLVMGSHRGCGVTQVLLVTADAACPPSEPLPALPAPAPGQQPACNRPSINFAAGLCAAENLRKGRGERTAQFSCKSFADACQGKTSGVKRRLWITG